MRTAPMSRSSPSSSTRLGARRRSPNARQVPRVLPPLERRWLPLRGTAETTQEVTQACLHLGRSHSSRRQGWGPRVKLSPKPGLLVPMPWALTPRGRGPRRGCARGRVDAACHPAKGAAFTEQPGVPAPGRQTGKNGKNRGGPARRSPHQPGCPPAPSLPPRALEGPGRPWAAASRPAPFPIHSSSHPSRL